MLVRLSCLVSWKAYLKLDEFTKNGRRHCCWYCPTRPSHASISRQCSLPPYNFLAAPASAGSWWRPAVDIFPVVRTGIFTCILLSCFISCIHTVLNLLLDFLWTRDLSRDFIFIDCSYSITDGIMILASITAERRH